MQGRKPKKDNELASTHHYTKKELERRNTCKNMSAGVDKGLSCPKVLTDPIAKAEWKRIMPLYRQMNIDVLNDLDVRTLIAYCMSVAVYEHAIKEWEANPRVLVEKYDRYGNLSYVQNPVIKTFNEQGVLIARFAEVLCLSPVGRTRIGKGPLDGDKKKSSEASRLEELFSRKPSAPTPVEKPKA